MKNYLKAHLKLISNQDKIPIEKIGSILLFPSLNAIYKLIDYLNISLNFLFLY